MEMLHCKICTETGRSFFFESLLNWLLFIKICLFLYVCAGQTDLYTRICLCCSSVIGVDPSNLPTTMPDLGHPVWSECPHRDSLRREI